MNDFFLRHVCLGLCLTIGIVVRAEEPVSFTRDIRPILSDHCFACHGPDEKTREAELRLDVADEALKSIVSGSLEESELWRRVASQDATVVMPPPDYGKPLTQTQRDLLRRWMDQGAEYQQHWSFEAPVRPDVPSGDFEHPIDAFIQDRLQQNGLTLSPVADKRTLARRITLDLTGLPPTPEEVEAFVADESDNAVDRLISDLFSRVQYGEHMARYWLDLARYADTHGLHLDNERSMWPYRDWVVRAFHQNIPFDEFTRWQLAGDLLDQPTQDQLIASGFNRCNVTTSEGGSINEEWVYRYAVDRTTTTAEVWMGLTAGCAVCHDHKFDPLSSVDYYSMYAFFHSAADPAMDGNIIDTPPILKLYQESDTTEIEALDREIADVQTKLAGTLAELVYSDPASLDPLPEPEVTQTVWFEDGFPTGAAVQSSGAPLRLISKDEGNVFSGQIALHRKAAGLEQDFYSSGAEGLLVPENGKVFVHCFLDPQDTPETIMIQFHTNGWKHRAVWGAEAKIGFGQPGTTEKVLMGDLPTVGEWVRLEVDAEKMGLSPKAKVTGFAFTQFGGTVTWDHLGVEARIDRAKDPRWSFQVWKDQNVGKRNNDLPEGLRQLVRGKTADKWTPDEAKSVSDFWLEHFYAGLPTEVVALKAHKETLEQRKKKIDANVPVTFIMADLPQPRESFVMIRGAYDKPGQKVSRGVPSFLPDLPAKPEGSSYNRLDLANWLVNGAHPLTARVTVNRLWQQLFGTGIVKTSGDFGSQGEPPSHPELLDWLAVEFVDSGWDIQKMIRLIMHSRTYQQSSQATDQMIAVDPENRLLSHGPRLRLDAEVLRDQALFVSGLLVDKVGGKGVNPYQPPNIWEPVGFGGSNTRNYVQGSGEDLYRRSLYTFLKRTAPPPFMSTFDAPNREQSCTRRQRSNTPLQALQLMNDIQHVEAARNLGSRILKESEQSTAARIEWVWNVVTGRPPSEAESHVASDLIDHFRKRYAADVASAQQLIAYGESKPDEQLDAVELATFTMLSNLVLNLDEVINKN
ncbi:MAG: PSD1 and planctomycete cytochrome C domain-containing protein [Pirellulaceae bacterium]